jgi:hypothetical protein
MADAFYPEAHGLVRYWASQSGYSVEQCAEVTALYSIQNAWPTNVVMARNAILYGMDTALPISRDNARAILNGAPIDRHLTRGLKVNDFYRSILRQPDCVGAMDRWMFRIFGRPQGTTWYSWVARCVATIARDYGLTDVSACQSRPHHQHCRCGGPFVSGGRERGHCFDLPSAAWQISHARIGDTMTTMRRRATAQAGARLALSPSADPLAPAGAADGHMPGGSVLTENADSSIMIPG